MASLDLTPKQKIYSSAGIFLVILTLIIIFIIAPLISQIKNDGLELSQKKQDSDNFSKNYQTLESAQKNYQAAQNEIYALPAWLPPGDALKFIMLIEKIAQATGNSQSVSASTDNQAATTPTLDFQVNLNGDFPSLIKFLTYLENAPYYNNVNSIQAQRLSTKEKAGNGNLNTVLKISVSQ